MFKSVFSKYFLTTTAIILISFTFLGGILMLFVYNYSVTEKKTTLTEAAGDIAESMKSTTSQRDTEVLLGKTVQLVNNVLQADVFIADTSGKIVIYPADAEAFYATASLSRDAVIRSVTKPYSEIGTLSGFYAKPHFTASAPVTVNGYTYYIAYVSTPANNLTQMLLDMFNMFFFAAAVVLFIAFVVIYFVTRGMVRPLRQMAMAATAFGKGDFTHRITVHENNEIGLLAKSFNEMAESLEALELMRSSFVANVSHELRTPMTSISGFVDGILDGTIPEEQRDHYLMIVSEEIKRLSRLVKSMLDISKIDNNSLELKLAKVNINELICRVVMSFEDRINEKKIDILGLDTMPEAVIVTADRDLLHQVVYNLVENAIKFTNEGGYIDFSAAKRNNKVTVAIKNSGVGIAADSLPYVFDRFYKTDKSRGLDKNGLGLGLFIVRSIINLHGGEIHAESVAGEYCSFIFTLPAA